MSKEKAAKQYEAEKKRDELLAINRKNNQEDQEQDEPMGLNASETEEEEYSSASADSSLLDEQSSKEETPMPEEKLKQAKKEEEAPAELVEIQKQSPEAKEEEEEEAPASASAEEQSPLEEQKEEKLQDTPKQKKKAKDKKQESLLADLQEQDVLGATEAELIGDEEEDKEDFRSSMADAIAEAEELENPEKIRGKRLPPAKAKRDPKLDEDPIEEEHLGLEENDFLTKRKVTAKDLQTHMSLKQKDFVGGNMKKVKDLAKVFEKGKSKTQDPKLDLDAALQNSKVLKRQVVAQQLLRNLHSKNSKEADNAEQMMRKELKLHDEFFDKVKKDRKAHQKDKYVKITEKRLKI